MIDDDGGETTSGAVPKTYRIPDHNINKKLWTGRRGDEPDTGPGPIADVVPDQYKIGYELTDQMDKRSFPFARLRICTSPS